MAEPVSNVESPGTGLAPRGGESATLLTIQDGRALNHAFRHLAEVQEALLDRLAAIEAERQQGRRWRLPLVAGGVVILAASLVLMALAVLRQPTPSELLQAFEAGLPDIQVAAPEVTVTAPADGVDAATVSALVTQLERAQAEQADYRRTLAALSERLLERETDTLETLRSLGRPAAAAPAAIGPGAELAPAAAAGDPASAQPMPATGWRDPWLGATNGLLAVAGFGRFQFDRGTRDPVRPLLREVTLLEWGTDGLLDSLFQAEEASFALHQMTGMLVVELRGGHRTRGGARAALPAEGWRFEFAGVDPRVWVDHFPALGAAAATDPAEIERVRAAVDQLLAVRRPVGYYRLAQLGGLEGSSLKLVQLQRFDGHGRLVRTLEADQLEIVLHPEGEVELLLRNGAIHEGGLRRPFYEDRFRVFLPAQPLAAWRAAGVPLAERSS